MTLTVPLATRVSALSTPASASTNAPDVMPDVAAQATRDALARGETHYTDRPGIKPLRQHVSNNLNTRYNLTTDAAHTVITCGVTEARFVTTQHLLNPGDNLYAVSHKNRMTGALTIRGATLTDNLSNASVLYLSSSTNEQTQRDILNQTPDNTIIIYELDDPDNTFHPAQLELFAARTVTIADLGETLGLAGCRIGFLVAPGERVAGLRDFKQALTICSTNLSQWAVLAALEAQA